MDITRLDLNLLIAFHAMMEHQNVTRAGQAVGLSQPATSAAVARLRALFNDPLFVRTGGGMSPTPLAVQLAEPVRKVLDLVKTDILQRSRFDPKSTQRTFSIAMPDIAELLFLPGFLQRMAEEAPSANFSSVVMAPRAMQEALENGTLDLAYGYFPDLARPGFFQQSLGRISYVCMVRADHPTIGERMTLEQFVTASHAVVHPAGRSHELVEAILQQRGIKRRVQVNVSHFTTLPVIISQSDLVAIVTRTAGARFASLAKVKLVEPPFKLAATDLKQYWHGRYHRDPANIWLRRIVRELHG
jgi:DNA-binding transcriptional LysR family regulator